MAATHKGKKPEPHKSPPAKPAATKKAAGVAASARKAAPPAKKATTAGQRMEAYGIDAIAEDVSGAKTMTEIAAAIGVTVGQLSTWIAADVEHSARVREARTVAARYWDERSEKEILSASDPFELARAKELAHHYRWRAAKIAPKEYGDKVTQEHTGANGGAITQSIMVSFVSAPKVGDDE